MPARPRPEPPGCDGSVLDPQLPTKWFRKHARAAGLPVIRLHDLRHSWATIALTRGVAAKVVSERLGHASVSITLDVYSHVLPALDEQAAAAVPDAHIREQTVSTANRVYQESVQILQIVTL